MYHCSRTGFINDIVIRPRYRTQLFLHVVDQLKIEGFSCYCAFPHLVLTDSHPYNYNELRPTTLALYVGCFLIPKNILGILFLPSLLQPSMGTSLVVS